jgi:predicted RNA-binding Zn ribbon-like protein
VSATRSRAATLRLVGGRPSLDLVNTVSWRGDAARREDHLLSADDAIVWATRAGLLTQAEASRLSRLEPAGLDLLLTSLLEVRNILDAFFTHPQDGVPPELQDRIRAATGNSTLEDRGGDGARWWPTGLGPLTLCWRIVLDAYELSRLGTQRVGRCEDEACAWVYYDTSKSRSRRWCSSQDCGNRERVRRHYEHTRTGVQKRGG